MQVGSDEAARVKALHSYHVLDTPPDVLFDTITELAASLFGVPISLVSLVDAERQWFKSRVGMSAAETARNISFCTHAVDANRPLVVSDATADRRFAKNPLVLKEPNIRFYAGVPLCSPDGYSLGTLCIIDREPRSLNRAQLTQLSALAKLATVGLELNRKQTLVEQQVAELADRQKERELLASMVVHDLRGPLTAVLALAMSSTEQSEALASILEAAKRMQRMLLDVLDICLADVQRLRPRKVATDLSALVRTVRDQLQEAGTRDRVELELPTAPAIGALDPGLVERVVSNLIDNAFRYSPAKTTVKVEVVVAPPTLEVGVASDGVPLTTAQAEHVFDPLKRGDAGSVPGHGLGLAFCRLAAEAHGGSVRVEPGSSVGNRFVLELPIGEVA